jgi:hypothetical protein
MLLHYFFIIKALVYVATQTALAESIIPILTDIWIQVVV